MSHHFIFPRVMDIKCIKYQLYTVTPSLALRLVSFFFLDLMGNIDVTGAMSLPGPRGICEPVSHFRTLILILGKLAFWMKVKCRELARRLKQRESSKVVKVRFFFFIKIKIKVIDIENLSEIMNQVKILRK